MATNPDDPAFPLGVNLGLTKREWFVGQALNGIMNSTLNLEALSRGEIAEIAADAAITQLNAPPVPPPEAT